MNSIRIFTPEDKKRLRGAKHRITSIIEVIDKAERCGVNCQSRRDQLKDTLEVLDNIEREFMAGM